MKAETAASSDKTPPPPAHVRVTLVCRYDGRFLPRPHERQLSYVGGKTNIITVDRSVRFPFIVLMLAKMYGFASPNDICIKYQLPGEDLDFLISVTNDEDLEHMMSEYDHLLRSAPKPAARLWLFIFPAHHSVVSTAAAAKVREKTDRESFVEGLNSIPLQLVPALDQNQMKFSTTQAAIPDLLTGDTVLSSLPETPIIDYFSLEAPPARSDLRKENRPQIAGESVVPSPCETRNQIKLIERLQIAENHQKKQLPNGIDETLTRVYNGEYLACRAQDRNQPATPYIFTGYCSDQRGIALAGGYRPVYHVPSPHGVHSSTAGQGYYLAVPAMYAVVSSSPEQASVLRPLYYP